MLRTLDLFSGAGMFSLGLERTGGFRTVAFCERDEYAQKVLRKHWRGVPVWPDVCKLRGSYVWRVDVITGGFPCQDISPSGSGAGLDGERSGLWREFARLIGEIRPRYVIVENSANLISGADGRWMGRVLGDLASLGFDAEWHIVPLAATGAPHHRERTIIIAHTPRVGQQGQGQLLKSINPAPDAYREASELVHAFQGASLPFVCGRHDGNTAALGAAELHLYGNAVGPALIEQIGHAILQAEGRA
jgi:DNA (cytosine-5)-methyltransferase 1